MTDTQHQPTVEEIVEEFEKVFTLWEDSGVQFNNLQARHVVRDFLRTKLTLVRDTARGDTIKEVTGILEGMKEENPNYDPWTNLIVIALNKVLDDALTAITNIAKGE